MESKTQKLSFVPRARLVSILGEQMISDSVVGLIELVKNSYDADASQVIVGLTGLDAAPSTCITVCDDGCGMSAADVAQRFLSPAADYKARARERSERTPRFARLPIGEKGVGRFAVQQLGHRLEMITRAADEPEVCVCINWDMFDDPDANLSDVTFDVTERDATVYSGDKTGTQLTISVAREHWDRDKVAKLQKGLRRLRSPHVDEGKQDFDICLICPSYPDLENLDQSDIQENYHYRFLGLVDEGGTLTYEYKACHPAVPEREVLSPSEIDLVPSARSDLADALPACGPFYLNLYVWDRTASYLKSSGVNRAELDAVAGVSLFRDKLRVLPYGEPGDDWLFMDRGRINNPSERIGNNQVLGYVEIDQQTAAALKDKTNREGLIDNSAFRDLKAMVRAAIRVFETHWLDDRPLAPAPTIRAEPPPVTSSLRRARSLASAIGESASAAISVTVVAGVPPGRGDGAMPARVITQREAAKEAISEIESALETQTQIEVRQADERELLLHLAATGLAVERLVHEVGRQAVAALVALKELRRDGVSGGSLSVLESIVGILQNEFRLLGTDGGITRFQQRRSVSVREAIRIAIELNEHVFEELNRRVNTTGDDFWVYARPSSLVQVVDNVLHNAAIWAASEVRIELCAESRLVRIYDDGPGVKLTRPGAIFEPHVTTRPDGNGLGLYIVRELLRNDGGSIRLEATDSGACFAIDLSGYPTKSNGGEKS